MTLENRREGLDGRPSAVRDLRYAGTVAAGCIAGVLGVGALTAPLLGWTHWPSSGTHRDVDATALALRAPHVRTVPQRDNSRHQFLTPAGPVAATLPLIGAPAT